MTVLEAANLLIEHFVQNDHFTFSKHLKNIISVPDEDIDVSEAAILIALEELEKQNFISKKNINKKDIWILCKPIALQTQEIQISLLTAVQIAQTINKCISKEEEKVNPIKLSEQDIINLMIIAKRP